VRFYWFVAKAKSEAVKTVNGQLPMEEYSGAGMSTSNHCSEEEMTAARIVDWYVPGLGKTRGKVPMLG